MLEALQAASPNRFRGIRHNVMWDSHPEVDSRAQPGTLASPAFRAGARVLALKGLSFDIFLYFPQLPELAEFAAGRARPAHHPQPHRRPAADRPVPPIGTPRCWPPGGAASRLWPQGPTSSSNSEGMGMP